MTGMSFAIGLGCGALGLGASAASPRQRWALLALFLAVMMAIGLMPIIVPLHSLASQGLGIATIAMAALAYFGAGAAPFRWLAVASLGLWTGVPIQSGAVSLAELAGGLLFLLLSVPAAFLRARKLQIVTYVFASWIITAGFINLAFLLFRPDAPATDHML